MILSLPKMSTFSAFLMLKMDLQTGPGFTFVVVSMKLSGRPGYLSPVFKTRKPSVFLFFNMIESPDLRMPSGE